MNINNPSQTNRQRQNSHSSEYSSDSSEQLYSYSIFGYTSDSNSSSFGHEKNLNSCRTIFSKFQAFIQEQINQKIKAKFTLAKFQGRGITEWYGPHPSGPSRELHQIEAGKISVNVFDWISVSFRIKLFQDQNKCSEIIQFYELLEQNRKTFKHEIRMGKGNAYFNVGNYVMAEKEFLRALRVRITEKVYENLIVVYGKLDHQEKLMYNVNKCLKINKRNVYAQFCKFRYSKEIFESRASIIKLSEENPSYYYLYNFLADKQNQPSRRLKMLKRILQYNPDYLKYHLTLAKVLEQPWKTMRLKNLVEKYPQNSEYYFELGIIYYDSNLFQEGIHHLQRSLQLNPYHFKAAFSLGSIYLRLNKYLEAIKYYKMSLQINPRCQNMRKAVVQFCQKYDEIQNQTLEIALEGLKLYPNNKFLLRYTAAGLVQKKLFDKALYFLQKHNKLEPSLYVDGIISCCYLSLDRIQEGLDFALQCIQKGSRHSLHICRRTIDHLVQGNHQKAILEWLLQLATIVLDKSYSYSFGISLDYIMMNINTHYLKGKERAQVITVLQQLTGSFEEAFKNRFKFLIVGKILLEFQEEKQSTVFFDLVSKLIRNKTYESIIDLQLDIFFGNIQCGLMSYQQRRKRQALKDLLKNSFASEIC